MSKTYFAQRPFVSTLLDNTASRVGPQTSTPTEVDASATTCSVSFDSRGATLTDGEGIPSQEVARWERNDGEPYFSGQLDMSPLHAGAWTKPNGDFNHASISLHQVTNVDLSNPAKIVVTTAKGEIVIQLFTDSDTLSYEWSQA